MAGGEGPARNHDGEGDVTNADSGSVMMPGAGAAPRGVAPRSFGRTMLSEWLLDPESVYLNHGTVGATPSRVLAVHQNIPHQSQPPPHTSLIPPPYNTHST